MIDVFVAASSPVVRSGLVSLIGERVGLSVMGVGVWPDEDGLRTWARADVVLLDVGQAAGDEVDDVVRRIAESGTAPVILLESAEARTWARLVEAGARGVLPVDVSGDEIAAAVEAAAAGLLVLHPAVASAVVVKADHGEGEALAEPLTPREIEVLRLMAEGVPNKSIARRLQISEHTVKFHAGSIFAKLGVSSRTEAVTAGVRRGVILL